MGDYGDPFGLQKRVKELEEKIEQLRLSRRVLMNLVEKIEKERSSYLARLEKENRRLQILKNRYARSIFYKNIQIRELELRLQDHSRQDSL